MASPIFLASPILLLILFHLLLVTEPTFSASIQTGTNSSKTGFRVTLTRVGSHNKFTKNHYFPKALSNANGPKYIPDSAVRSPLKADRDEFLMNLAIGTPPVNFEAVMDTGSDLIWKKCKPNTASLSSPFYDPSESSSFVDIDESCKTLDTGCIQHYADGTYITYSLGKDILTFENVEIPNVIFGCGEGDSKFDGMLGMGRGSLSMVSQLKERVFSYCLASSNGGSKTSILLAGFEAISAITNTASGSSTKIQRTPLLRNSDKESYYYLSLEGISVGETRLPISKSDFAIVNGKGGMIIDSGTRYTYLEESVFNKIKSEFMNQTKLEEFDCDTLECGDFKLCFKSPYHIETLPKLVFHFVDADLELPRESYIYKMSEYSGVACLSVTANDKDNDEDHISIFGNIHQENMMVLYDLDSNSLSFMPANCDEL